MNNEEIKDISTSNNEISSELTINMYNEMQSPAHTNDDTENDTNDNYKQYYQEYTDDENNYTESNEIHTSEEKNGDNIEYFNNESVEKINNIENFNEENHEYTENVSSSILLDENRALRRTIEGLKKAKELMAKVVESEKERIQHLEDEVNKLQKIDEKQSQELTDIKASLKTTEKELNELVIINNDIKKNLQETDDAKIKITNAYHKEKENQRILKNKLELYQDEIVELKATISQIEPIVDKLRNNNANTNNQKINTKESKEYLDLKYKYESIIEELKSYKSLAETLKNERNEMSDHIRNIKEQQKTTNEPQRHLLEKLNEYENIIKNEKEKNIALQRKLNELSNILKEKEQERINEETENTTTLKPANPQSIKPVNESKKCQRCGKINLMIAKFCAGCGVSFDNVKPIIIQETEDILNDVKEANGKIKSSSKLATIKRLFVGRYNPEQQ